MDIDPGANIGPVGFRLQTPLGTTPEGRILVEPFWGESPDKEPNDTVDTAVETFLPAVLTGEIGKPGDVDYFKIKVRAGEELVFENGAIATGSTLQPVVAILREDQSVVKEFGADGGPTVNRFAHKFEQAGRLLCSCLRLSGERTRQPHLSPDSREVPLRYKRFSARCTRRIASRDQPARLEAPAKIAVKGEASATEPGCFAFDPRELSTK